MVTLSIIGNVLQCSDYNKRNLANWIFTRLGWVLTVGPLLALQYRNRAQSEQQERVVSFIRIGFASSVIRWAQEY